MSQKTISDRYRAEQAGLNRRAADQLADVFPALNFRDIDGTAPGWTVAVEAITVQHHGASLGLAQDAYTEFRRDAGVVGRVSFVLPELDRRKLRVSLLNEGPYAAKKAMAAGGRIEDVARVLFGSTSGTALMYGQAGGRDMITGTTSSDPKAVGWKRVTRAGACGFCRALADRGAVYYESSAVFSAHPGCACSAVAVFDGGETGPEASVLQYLGSKRHKTPADRQRLNAWVAGYR